MIWKTLIITNLICNFLLLYGLNNLGKTVNLFYGVELLLHKRMEKLEEKIKEINK